MNEEDSYSGLASLHNSQVIGGGSQTQQQPPQDELVTIQMDRFHMSMNTEAFVRFLQADGLDVIKQFVPACLPNSRANNQVHQLNNINRHTSEVLTNNERENENQNQNDRELNAEPPANLNESHEPPPETSDQIQNQKIGWLEFKRRVKIGLVENCELEFGPDANQRPISTFPLKSSSVSQCYGSIYGLGEEPKQVLTIRNFKVTNNSTRNDLVLKLYSVQDLFLSDVEFDSGVGLHIEGNLQRDNNRIVHMSNVQMKGAKEGICVSNRCNVFMENVRIGNVQSFGIKLFNCSTGIIKNVRIDGSQQNGCVVDSCGNIIVMQNGEVANCQESGVDFEYSPSTLNAKILGLKISNCQNGISMRQSQNVYKNRDVLFVDCINNTMVTMDETSSQND
eukprot:TRINITY_DN10731_c1_g1_i2.p1 TRINITY_DN10731_c1_g1~~TRINITY_DN10731_c1_g1_i2.p1  ORF type:complete len:394 (-),score=31.10 TRINITY_DN10731_c1_g1_i2:290-1471(-)